tara:strand:- start:10 stop:297 length:288 start_codon:yes stop_codon:yes gene_type:complete
MKGYVLRPAVALQGEFLFVRIETPYTILTKSIFSFFSPLAFLIFGIGAYFLLVNRKEVFISQLEIATHFNLTGDWRFGNGVTGNRCNFGCAFRFA